jgi:hypothetical protein
MGSGGVKRLECPLANTAGARHNPAMGQVLSMEAYLIAVTTDDLVRGQPKKQVWVAAAARDRAVPVVLDAIPEGWTAVLAGDRLKPRLIAALDLGPGDVRQLTWG